MTAATLHGCCSTRRTARPGRSGPTLARRCSPRIPATRRTRAPAAALAERDFAVAPNVRRPARPPRTLAGCDVLVIAHPSDPRWERTTGTGSPRLSDEELDAIEAFVRGGGGLIVLGETEQEKYGNNLNELLAPVRPAGWRTTPSRTTSTARRAELGPRASSATAAAAATATLLARVRAACFYRATTISADQRRAGARADARDRLGARRAADRRRRARRRPRRRARRLGPVRRRLHRRARPLGAVAEHRRTGPPRRLRATAIGTRRPLAQRDRARAT